MEYGGRKYSKSYLFILAEKKRKGDCVVISVTDSCRKRKDKSVDELGDEKERLSVIMKEITVWG